ncbi:MAG: Spy/CpxP family protein refolding chaperone [Deltaproteobacteria bacterium]|nr:Spy/CpxP family protein refolding chaperone [Deltaproteobacteria bacterium]
MKRRLIPALSLMLSMMLVGGGVAHATGDMHENTSTKEWSAQGKDKHFQEMATQLKLTSAQKEQIKTLFKEAREQNKPLREKLIATHKQMRELIEANTLDEAAVKALATEQGNLHVEMAMARARLFHQMNAILTPEQRAHRKTLRQTNEKKRFSHAPREW